MASIYTKLTVIQNNLKAPKNLRNSFGNYNYRNAEGILEALKPYLFEHGCSVLLTDAIETVGGRIYVKATATIVDCETGDAVSTSAYAREAEVKKGMDESQITGCASSYARKYALNGLLLLDDTKDADTDEYAKQTVQEPGLDPQQFVDLTNELIRTGVKMEAVLDRYKIKDLKTMTQEQYKACMKGLKATKSAA